MIPEWIEENMSKRPQKGDAVFQLDPKGAKTNGRLEIHGGDTAYICARGYLVAARLAVEHIHQHGGDQDFLVYPIVFLYRHHVELMLKKLILLADEGGIQHFTGREPLDEAVRQKLTITHSLQWLWDQLRPILKTLGKHGLPPADIQGIGSYIRQLNEIDPNSTQFRYTTAIEETKAKLGRVQQYGGMVGIQNFAEAMERLANYLEGIDSYFDYAIDCYHQALAESYDYSY
jgi:hypothetical protein